MITHFFLANLGGTLNLVASAFLGGIIGATSTFILFLILNKKYEQEIKKINSYTAKLKSLENNVFTLKHKTLDLVKQVGKLQEEKAQLQAKIDELNNLALNLEGQAKKVTPEIGKTFKEKPIKKIGLYQYILEGLEKSIDFYNPQNYPRFEDYLQSLKKPAEQLWESYRSNQVIVNYSDASTQAAYLIRYYPHYVQMTYEILQKCSETFAFGEKVNACFFGAGPCPEVAGLAQFLTQYYPQTKEIFVQVYDIASDQWALSRTITKDFVIPKLWKGQFSGNARNLDLCSANSFQAVADAIENSHLFVFQNCLNEIWNISTTKENIKFLLESAPLNSFIVIGDLRYAQNRYILEDIAKFVQRNDDYKIIVLDELDVRSSLRIPQIVIQNLLTSEGYLIPRSRIKFMFLVIGKF
ncbi:hypothetical protein PMG71_17995 [Roseofilum sp. BLCC_M154]|uniref:CheR-type methyltransferase domain-containing protein n=1 Tax=Roseofilum acuticapitatum BLCC-M154 TaxID=3022444 RepID=A0ABT7AWQ3_9CYAN|nr:hypothetical protein [Roseofilum acuticapitatum]MDJ1171325.1 hypothetical protein [Roseofilum acuticapitatum BLCC-M154]